MRRIGFKNAPLTWEELEAILLWTAIGFSLVSVAHGMEIPKGSVLHHIYRGKKAQALVAKSQAWKDYDREKELAKVLAATNWPDEGRGVAGQKGQELHPKGCSESCCAGTRLRDLGRVDAILRPRDAEPTQEPGKRVRELEWCEAQASLLWFESGWSTKDIARGMGIPFSTIKNKFYRPLGPALRGLSQIACWDLSK